MQEPRTSPTTALVAAPCPECGAPHHADGQHTLDVRTDEWICRRSSAEPLVAAAPINCPDCCGCGVQHYRSVEERCSSCGGSGVRPNPHLHDAPAAPMAAAAA